MDCAALCTECGICENCRDTCPECELCEECCNEVSMDLGCDHGICSMSREWSSHYCEEGEHCVEDDGYIDHDSEYHWVLCGKGCSIQLNKEAHVFGEGNITKEATSKEEGILTLICGECGYEKKESIPKLKGEHKHKYTDKVVEPTCTESGYTVHSCDCGHEWTDSYKAAGDHNYSYKYTDSEHYKECSVCHEKTAVKAHKFGEWKTVKKAGYTYKGEKQRACRDCGYIISAEIPVIALTENKVVIVIPDFPVEDRDTDKEDSGSSGEGSGSVGEGSSESSDKTYTKEIVTKGKENTVPTLPTLPDAKEGNKFEGWANKATGETVKKGDVLKENIELVPVWKDCGADKHGEGDENGRCVNCGYILANDSKPSDEIGGSEEKEENTEAVTENETEAETDTGSDDGKAPGKTPVAAIIILSVLGVASAGCTAVIIFVTKKKK